MERERQVLEADLPHIEDTHGRNMLNLVLAAGYVRRLIDSASVVKYLSCKHTDLLAELEQIVESTDLGAVTAESGSSGQGNGTPSE